MHNNPHPLTYTAVELLQTALTNCTPQQAATVIAAADLDAMTAHLHRITGQATARGIHAGWTLGYLQSEADTENAWKPLAQKIRADANRPNFEQLLDYRREEHDPAHSGHYRPLPSPDHAPPSPNPDHDATAA